MKLRFAFVFAMVGLLFGACMSTAEKHTVYLGTIEKVDQPLSGSYFTLTEGEKTLNRICVRLSDSKLIRIELHGLYSAQIHGEKGDRVSFSYDLPLPLSGELTFDSLRNYEIRRKNP